MDTKQELKLLGFFGILKETFKLIFSHKKIFTQITLALIIPLSLIFQGNIVTSHFLSPKIFERESLFRTLILQYYLQIFQPKFLQPKIFGKKDSYIFILISSLHCTSTIVNTIFCIYTDKDVTFKKAMALAPKICKQVLYTYLVSFGILFLYEYIRGAILVLILGFLFKGFLTVLAVFILILLLAASVYITIILHLGIFVSVLEADVYGIKAIERSKNLIKGKLGVAVGMLIVFSVCSVAIDATFENFVISDDLSIDIGIRIGIGILCFILQLLVILFGFVVQTVIYFVCKSNLDEDFEANITMNAPQDHKPLDVQELLPV